MIAKWPIRPAMEALRHLWVGSRLAKGATIVTMPRFNLDGLLDILERHRVTWLHVAPPGVLAFATAPQVEDRDLSALKMVRLREIERVEEIPKSASGKILRRPLREEHGAAKAAV